ncbi:MAG: glycosyltransferase family 39 protein [Flavobacteriales bacterium]|nr:glycosyltransferase family 39 protein [Flavobacteriales bacterium]
MVSPTFFRWSLLGLVVVVLAGLGLDLMEVDAAQYAAMTQEMMHRGDLLHLVFRGADYLDKPPLLFWSAAASHALFGVSDWSYRLPSVLAAFLGLFALYRFTRVHHDPDTARRAVLVMGCSAAFLLMTNDVRTDTLLTAAVITTIWTGSAWMERRRWWALVGCGIALGAGLLAKGPIAAVAPALALALDAAWRARWRRILDPAWLIVAAIAGLMLAPMLIGLYEQHGLHGIRFFFWEQSFGRITGANRWKDDSTVLYFLHELPWLLLPWTLFLVAGLGVAMRHLRTGDEQVSLFGGLSVLVALSLSQFKLPHYIYVALPLFAVVAARGMPDLGKGWWRAQLVVLVIVLGLSALVCGWSFASPVGTTFAAVGLLAIAWVATAWRSAAPTAVIGRTVGTVVLCGLALNLHVYPALLAYQANAHAGRWAAQHGLGPDRFKGLQVAGTALDRYAGFTVPWLSNVEEAARVIGPGVHIYTDPTHEAALRAAGLAPVRVASWPDVRVQVIGLDFLVPTRREALLEERVIVRF